jgi:hypothetical protein
MVRMKDGLIDRSCSNQDSNEKPNEERSTRMAVGIVASVRLATDEPLSDQRASRAAFKAKRHKEAASKMTN